MKQKIKKLLPESVFLFYHFYLALKAAVRYRFPSREMVVIGVTGTKGKTSTSNFIWSTLMAGNKKTGMISTANIRIGNKEEPNRMRMTMPGRDVIQKLLKRMLDDGCTHVVIETSSEGLKQFRHVGINYDYAVFTNLHPEHLPSHGGSFEKYREQKGVLFRSLTRSKHKNIEGRSVPKVSIVNADSPEAEFFGNFSADKKLTYSIEKDSGLQAKNIETNNGVLFEVNKNSYKLSVPGIFNVYNALPAIAIAELEGVEHADISRGLRSLELIPGRMEKIDGGQNFTVFVDYAHEAESMRQALSTVRSMVGSADNVIVILGAEGGGRDKGKRPAMGAVAGNLADVVIISNTDPYDDDPEVIAEDIARAAEEAGKVRGKNLFIEVDRRLGMRKAFSVARPGDAVIITGKGAEESMHIAGGKSIPWDERAIVREELIRLKK